MPCKRDLVMFVAISMLSSPINGQQMSQGRSGPPNMSVERLRTAPGRLLAQGKNRVPVGELQVLSYRLEEVSLPEPIEIDQGQTQTRIENAVRLTVVLDHLVNGSYTIWIDDDGYLAVPTKNNEITSLIIGNAGLNDEATITVKLGTGCHVNARSTLPEKLAVPKRLRSNRTSLDLKNYVSHIRTVPGSRTSSDSIELELVTSMDFPVRNAVMVLQIGDQEFEGDPSRLTSYILRFTISSEDFKRTRDGDLIRVKYGTCSLGGVKFGHLDKSLLNR